MDLTSVFTDRCEVILYKGQWIYPIFKCGWSGFQYAKEESKYDEEIGTLETINVFIRDPDQRWHGAVNKYAQLNNMSNEQVVTLIEREGLVDKHWVPQYFWIMHLRKFYLGDITLLPMEAITHERNNPTPNKKPTRAVKGYGENDRILIKMCNQTHNITDVLKKARYVLS
jgi:hypothetical protein|tara:strand:- start:1848 stop:2357 length:510 start_codon:yes stop_codon:yes gene_type:complete